MSSILFALTTPSGQTFGIEHDAGGRQYTVVEQKTGKNGLQWVAVPAPYYGTLKGAAKRLLETGLAPADHQTVNTLIWRMDVWASKVEAAVKEVARAQAAEASP